ncbi:MAG: UDP-N-acetylglucosamine 1-carboxyvinyltransferase [Chloroflexi bacterium]|nr:UDP-N-acetylglucosamine 1-carboxyvinyltransferase [Chloroflexota bacterium]MDA1146569.1 UDP-N-acetylglucosamine 1-carboxyvinyltransferase [Chloroflexota bacterium]MQC82741.1 UDP-N-acetylglucosamine 1-carboxyvinyltransferase [Chloroflexota bacterium]PKB56767.1 MAG: UDP-N-acetylglucosamine 1-carboxyvinyltransferase [SAR202 cluster bacterium Casp-Chloro-G1]
MSERFVIRGGRPLKGEVAVSGSKNAALYTLAAGLLSADPVTIRNVPEIADIGEMADVCRALGAEVEVDGTTVYIQAREFTATAPPTALVMALRASFLVMGPVLARAGEAACASPGGDVIGVRPLDVHLAGFRALGAEVSRSGAEWVARAPKLTGARIFLDYPSVLGTVNVMFAAALAEGTTTIVNAAAEPEVEMAAAMLNSMGARITGHGTAIMTIEGVERMHGTDFEVIPDRIEAGTYLLAGLATGGDLHVTNADPAALDSLIAKFHELDAKVETIEGRGVRVSCPRKLRPVQVQAVPYPGFPTDLHAPMAAALTQVPGVSTIHERVFDNRTLYVGELRTLGAKIITGGQTVIVEGGGRLNGAAVRALDIRAGAAVVIAGLAADGETSVGGIEHLDRGYAHLAERLCALGADVSRA